MNNLVEGYNEEQFCEIILNLNQWFRRCRLNDFLSRALAALMFSSTERHHLCNFGRGHYVEHSCKSYFKFGPVVQMLLKEKVYARQTKTDHNG